MKYILRLLFIVLIISGFVTFSTSAGVVVQNSEIVVVDSTKNSSLNRARKKRNKDVVTDVVDSLGVQQDSAIVVGDSLLSEAVDTTSKKPKKGFLDDILSGNGKDSLIYDIKTGNVFMYNKGVVNYQDKALDADYINMNIANNAIIAKGVKKEVHPDSIKAHPERILDSATFSKPKFKDGPTTYDMDSIIYNIKSEKAKIYGIAFKEGEGTLKGKDIKKMDDGIFNIHGGTYSTCDADHPHFFLQMTKAQYVQNKDAKKIILGPSYLVLEDVPLPLGVPFGFFPMISDRNSGVILPEIGEENLKGFYLRGFGYYFAFNDYLDIAARAGIYTLGSWETNLTSTYKVLYKFNGNFGFDFSKDKVGTKGAKDFRDMSNYRLRWTHSQDSKFMPGSSFAASVNYSSSSFNKYDAQNMQDYVSAQTNSTISYSKTWAGTPFSFSSNVQHSQNNRDSSVLLSIPNFVFNVSRFFPFQRKYAEGKQKWYEKISLSYTNTFNNSVTTKQNLMFKSDMFDNMRYGMKHDIPINTSFNLLKYVNVSPNATYTERWYFKKINKEWNPTTERVEAVDTVKGFNRVYDYRFSVSLTTKLYGMYTFKGDNPAVKAVRHVLTPSVSFSYTPNFGDPKYGYYKPIQSNKNGDITYYSPFENEIYGVPGRGESASMSFSLGNTLEMKVRSDSDTTGYKKVKLLESLSISSSYNFLADSLNLAPFSVSARTTLFKTLGINVNATLDPYAIDDKGRKINQFSIKRGKLVRLTSLGFSFGYSFRSFFGSSGEKSGTGAETLSRAPTTAEEEYFARNNISYAEQQQFLARQTYYNFSIPWNLSFNYNFSYSKSGHQGNVNQTLSFNGSLNLTPKFGLAVNGGFDFETMTLTPGNISLTRDLHCWQLSFDWVPVGFRKSWNFRINVKSGMLRDLKYEKSSGYMDNYSSYY